MSSLETSGLSHSLHQNEPSEAQGDGTQSQVVTSASENLSLALMATSSTPGGGGAAAAVDPKTLTSVASLPTSSPASVNNKGPSLPNNTSHLSTTNGIQFNVDGVYGHDNRLLVVKLTSTPQLESDLTSRMGRPQNSSSTSTSTRGDGASLSTIGRSVSIDMTGAPAPPVPSPLRDPSLPPAYSEIPGTVPLHTGRNSGPPPSYDDVVNPDAPPPSYNSLFGQMREARKTSNTFVEFLKKLVLILLGTLGVTILVGFTVLIPLTMVAVGASHMDDCPAENIPMFLLVGGIVWVFKNLLNLWSTCRKPNDNFESEQDVQLRYRKYESLINCFLFGWFIAGTILVYRVYPPMYDNPESREYCNRTVYLYAFWLVTTTFVFFGLFFGCICCLAVSSIIRGRTSISASYEYGASNQTP